MTLNSLRLWDRLSSVLQRLSLDTDLNDEEGADLAKITDDVNEVREKYTDRKVDEVCEQSGP
jgi:hypothetical protein